MRMANGTITEQTILGALSMAGKYYRLLSINQKWVGIFGSAT